MIPESSYPPRYEQTYINGTSPIQPSRQPLSAPYRAPNHQPTNHWNQPPEPLNSYVRIFYLCHATTNSEHGSYSSTIVTKARFTGGHSWDIPPRTITLTIGIHRRRTLCSLLKLKSGISLCCHYIIAQTQQRCIPAHLVYLLPYDMRRHVHI